jgi:hypothetical protein
MLLHGEGAKVNKFDPVLLVALDDLYAIIAQYDLENVYNMDETGMFFRLLPRYILLMPDEDISTTRGKKKSKDRVSLIVCANAVGTQKIPCALIGKPEAPACIRTANGMFHISVKLKLGQTWKRAGSGSTKCFF